MTGKGWHNGTDIISKPYSKEYAEGWERIFAKKEGFKRMTKKESKKYDKFFKCADKHGCTTS